MKNIYIVVHHDLILSPTMKCNHANPQFPLRGK